MDFALTEEQPMLRNSVERLFADQYAFDARKRYVQEPDGWSRQLWKRYAELGLLGLPFAEERRRFGRRAGRNHDRHGGDRPRRWRLSLISQPSCSAAVCSGLAAAKSCVPSLSRRLQPANCCSRSPIAERQARYDLADITATARREGTAYVLDGAKIWCCMATARQRFIVSARLSAAGSATKMASRLFLIDASSERRGDARLRHGRWIARRRGDVHRRARRRRCRARRAGRGFSSDRADRRHARWRRYAPRRSAPWRHAGDHGRLSEDAQAVRRHHRQLPGLQHRASEMVVALEQARSMAMLATMMAGENNIRERRRGDFSGESADRPLRPPGRSGGDSTPRRNRHDHGGEGGPLFQARHHHRHDVRRRRLPSRIVGASGGLITA